MFDSDKFMNEAPQNRKKRWIIIAVCCVAVILPLLYFGISGPLVGHLLLAEENAQIRNGWHPDQGPIQIGPRSGSELLRWLPDRLGQLWPWYGNYFQDQVSEKYLFESLCYASLRGEITIDEARAQLDLPPLTSSQTERESNK